MIVWVKVVLNGTVLLCDWRFDNLFGSHLHSQSELLRPSVNSFCNIIINIEKKTLSLHGFLLELLELLEFIDFVVEKIKGKMNKIILGW